MATYDEDERGAPSETSLPSAYAGAATSSQGRPAETRGADLIRREVSLELAPAQVDGFQPPVSVFPEGSLVFLTHLSGKPLADIVLASRKLLDAGLTPVPHVAARNFENTEDFVRHLHALAAAGVRQGLFLGGNSSDSRRPLERAIDLLSHPALAASGFERCFVGGYPEGHPEIVQDTLLQALDDKVEIIRSIGMEPAVVTQFAFDGAAMANWAADLRAAGLDLPIRFGVAGVTSLPKLIKFAMICGVGQSLGVLRKSAGSLLKVMRDQDPAEVVDALSRSLDGSRSRRDALHFFPFGGWQKTLDWLAEARSH